MGYHSQILLVRSAHTVYFLCFVWIWEQTAIISLYSINWLVFIIETECVYCAVRTGHLTFNNSTFCPHSVFMCFVWIWEQKSNTSLYSFNWLVCITEPESVYCVVRTECLNTIQVNFSPKTRAHEDSRQPACYPGGLGWNGGHSLWDLWSTVWHLDRFFFRVRVLSSVSVISPMFHTRLGIRVAFSRRTNGRSLGTFGNRRAPNRKVFWLLVFKGVGCESTNRRAT